MTMPKVAMSMPITIASSVRSRRTTHETGIMKSTISDAFSASIFCCKTCKPRSVMCEKNSGMCAATAELLFQSVRKFGCRSQSWYIISQKQLMMSRNEINRGLKMLTIVRLSTCHGVQFSTRRTGNL